LFLRDWRFWLGTAISILFLGILGYQVDLGKFRQSLQQANYWYVFPAIVLYFIAVYFRSVRWRYLLSPIAFLPVARLYPVVLTGYLANNILPVRLGEIVRSYYLSRRDNVPASTALASVAVERIYDGLTLVLFAMIAAPVLLMLGQFSGYGSEFGANQMLVASTITGIFVAGLVVLTVLAKSSADGTLVEWFLQMVPQTRGRNQIRSLVHGFIQGLAALNEPGKHLALLAFSLPVWLVEGSMYVLVGYSFGLDEFFPSLWVILLAALLLTATSNLVTSLPSAIGGIGPFELVAQQTLVAMGVDATVAAAYSLFLHIGALWLPVNLAGLAHLLASNVSMKQLTAATTASSDTGIAPAGEVSVNTSVRAEDT